MRIQRHANFWIFNTSHANARAICLVSMKTAGRTYSYFASALLCSASYMWLWVSAILLQHAQHHKSTRYPIYQLDQSISLSLSQIMAKSSHRILARAVLLTNAIQKLIREGPVRTCGMHPENRTRIFSTYVHTHVVHLLHHPHVFLAVMACVRACTRRADTHAGACVWWQYVVSVV